MDYQIKKLPKSKIEIDVVLPASEMKRFLDEAKKKLTEGTVIKGFRPGKAPAELAVGEGDILDAAAHLAMNSIYPDILEKEKLLTLGPAKADVLKIAAGDDFSFRLSASVFPEVDLPDYKEIASRIFKEKKPAAVDDKEVEMAFNWLRRSRGKLKPVERPAQKGDFVQIEIANSLSKEELEKNKKLEKDSFILGENHYLMAGFEDQIAGMKAEEERSFSLIAGPEHWDEKARGKEINFFVKMGEVSELELPEETDDWAKTVGSFDGLAGLKKSLKEGLLAEKEQREKERIRLKALEEISAAAKVDLPEELVEAEIKNKIDDIARIAGEQGASLDEYLKKINKDESALKKELADPAEKSVKQFLVLKEIARENSIEAGPEELEAEKSSFLSRYPKERGEKIDNNNLEEYIKERIITEKTFQFLEKI